MTIIYDNRFNQNELFVLTLLLAYIIVFMLPKRFPLLITLVFIFFGITSGLLMDHSISIHPIDLYDVNDSSKYTIMDFLLYCAYGPFSYFMIYFFDKFKLKKQHIIFYIPLCSTVSICFEWLARLLGVFHYKNGYTIIYSFPIYLMVNSILLLLYFKLCKEEFIS